MEEEKAPLIGGEIEEVDADSDASQQRHVRTKVPEVEIRLYRQGKGPIEVFKSTLGGWDQDQLEVRNILDKYGFKSIYAFNPQTGRGVPIRFNPRNGRSMLSYRDGGLVYIDGEPKSKFQQRTWDFRSISWESRLHKKGILLSQRKYVLDLLAEIGKLGAKPCSALMTPELKLWKDDDEPFGDPKMYRRLVGKLNYLIVTRPGIAYCVSTVSQFMSSPQSNIG